ncbi:Vacuolar import and degradation protein 27 [Smittium culicis]|uniref:Vacuolar import and degradation protein 27 n=1 Tax=Smittium culicis TaxID=133412 RepID=A0A1R1Y4U2_9FUNG|nr:Vacuolar import and degradation protein 27 [Smittium culicis]
MFSLKGITSFFSKEKLNSPNKLASGQFFILQNSAKVSHICIFKDSSISIEDQDGKQFLIVSRIFEEGERELEAAQDPIDERREFELLQIKSFGKTCVEDNNNSFTWSCSDKNESTYIYVSDPESVSNDNFIEFFNNFSNLHTEISPKSSNATQTHLNSSHSSNSDGLSDLSERFVQLKLDSIRNSQTPKKHNIYENIENFKTETELDQELEDALHEAEQELALNEVQISLPFEPSEIAQGELTCSITGELYAYDSKSQSFQLIAPLASISVVKVAKFNYYLVAKSITKNYVSQQVLPKMNPVFNSEYLSIIWNVFSSTDIPYSLSVRFLNIEDYKSAHSSLIKAAYEVLNLEPWEKVSVSDQNYMLDANEESIELNNSTSDFEDSDEESNDEESNDEESSDNDEEVSNSESDDDESGESETDDDITGEGDYDDSDNDNDSETRKTNINAENRPVHDQDGKDQNIDNTRNDNTSVYDSDSSSEFETDDSSNDDSDYDSESEDDAPKSSINRHSSSDNNYSEFHKGYTNSALAVGHKDDRSYVLRGNQIGVFKHTEDDNIEHSTTITKISDSKGTLFTPSKMMLHEMDTAMVMMNPSAPNSLFKMDLEVGKVVEEWKVHDYIVPLDIIPETKYAPTTGTKTLVGISHNSLFKIDPRIGNEQKLVESQYKQYFSKNKFSSAATNELGNIVVGSEKGEIRLFDRIGVKAKTSLPALGEPIIGIDVTADGRFVVATFETYLLLIDTLIPKEFQKSTGNDGGSQPSATGFTKSFPTNRKPMPKRLQLRPEHIVYMGEAVKFTPARFNTSSGTDGTGSERGERTIVSSTGSFVLTWNLRKVLATGRGDSYHIKQHSDNIIANNFTFGVDKNIVVTMPNDVLLVGKNEMAKPNRKTLASFRAPLKSKLSDRDNVVDSPY